MAVQLDTSGKDDLKTQFATPEGDYRLMTLSEYSRPNRVGYQNNQNSPQVRVSIVSLPAPPPPPPIGQLVAAGTTPNNNNSNNVALAATKPQPFPNGLEHPTASGFSAVPVGGDRICFNYGKELYVYSYRGAKKATDLNKPIDKKLYKGTSPSCHDFNGSAATFEGAPLLVGFSTGQIQLVHPGRREQGKLFNEERYIDKTKVTCLKWIPGSQNQFLVSHASGCIYLYHEDLPCAAATPSYTPYKGGDGYIVLAAKSKATKNPLYKWCFGQHENASINEFCFSPCGQHLAVVSQDGFLRIFHYERMELVGIARSYFGGFLCVCWSPDGKYVVVGGEDDLVTVFSLHEQRVVARGQGHRSWVSVVAFDPYTTSYTSALDGSDELSDEELSLGGSSGREQQRAASHHHHHHHSGAGAGYCHGDGATSATNPASCDKLSAQNRLATCYRLGSVSQDTQICLWDITEDVLRQSFGRVIKSANHNTGVKDVLVNGTANGIGTDAKADKFGKAGKASVGTDTVDNVSFKPQLATLPTVGAPIGSNSAYGGGTVKPIGSGGSSAYGNNLNCDDKANSDSSSDKESVDSKIIKRANSGATSEDSIAPGGSGTGTTSTSSTKSSVVAAVIGGKKDKSTTGERSKGAGAGAGDSQSNSGGQQHSSTFNSITQRLTSLSFGNSGGGGGGGGSSGGGGSGTGGAGSGSSTSSGSGGSSCDKNDKPSKSNTGGSGGGGKRSIITLGSKSFSNNSNSSNSNSNSLNNNHVLNSNNNNNQSLLSSSGSPSGSGGGGSGSGGGGGGMSSTFSALMSSSLSKKGGGGGGGGGTAGSGLIGGFAPCGRIASSYDPMKLIGTPACPRYDDCPVLEPLICKKIAHERLTALIFREDCFLTACQDGFVYTWARPGFVNIPQHLSSTPSAPPGGTVV